MRVALFTINNFLAGTAATFGYRETLERMGHEVLPARLPGNQVQVTPELLAECPTIEQLMECDLVLSTHHEYVQPWLEAMYPFAAWDKLMSKVPVLARFDESMDRGDLLLPHRMPDLLQWAKHYSFPAAQDADTYNGQWLPFGTDTTIFKPGTPLPEKKYDVGFIGTMYPKRHEYLTKLIQFAGRNTKLYVGNVAVQDIAGVRSRDTALLLADNYRDIKIFFCFPPISRLVVSKIPDIMACDTLVLYPRFPGEAMAKNYSPFEHEKHIVYYELGFFANNGKQLQYYLQHPEEAERIAKAGGELVRAEHTLEQMIHKMMAYAGVFAPKEVALLRGESSVDNGG
jgi:hypothetical protein